MHGCQGPSEGYPPSGLTPVQQPTFFLTLACRTFLRSRLVISLASTTSGWTAARDLRCQTLCGDIHGLYTDHTGTCNHLTRDCGESAG